MTPSGIEPATCRFVAQCLNYYATARPPISLHVFRQKVNILTSSKFHYILHTKMIGLSSEIAHSQILFNGIQCKPGINLLN